ncbi:Inorganic phosphate transporter [Ceraceosorus bombacis]|uniref:Inorganic phosphate transporter n=1 Tax=Ceraceosorus bombacis TaxID=401625 RepID=A0A0P1BM94_9BASI|nr:Inorganic phosphate transporter [Ceraceosorus bombacis]
MSAQQGGVLHDAGTYEDKKGQPSVEVNEVGSNKKSTIKIGKELGPVALIFACGTALFSDGYINAASGPVKTILGVLYENRNPNLAHDLSLFSSLAFAGTVAGMLIFGVLTDRIGRKPGMLFCCIWLTLWSIIIAGAWGAGGSISGLFVALQAYRFLQGIALGAEYPCGSVAASENTEAPGVNPKHTQSLFILATNTAIDFGFVAASLVAAILLEIFSERHLEWVWRLTLGLGALPPMIIFFFRTKMHEPEQFKKGAIKKPTAKLWWLIIKKYWVKLSAVSLSWFIYDWVSYPAGLYSSFFVSELVPDNDLQISLWYGVLINAFYIPGTIIGALLSDRLGPKNTMILGLFIQAAFGFGLAGGFGALRNESIAGIIVLYGFFVAAGEMGPGNNLGLLASKAVAPTAVRGTFYGIAAAIGKVGAFVATYVYDQIQADLSSDENATIRFSGPFYIGAGLALVSAAIVFVFIPQVTHDGMKKLDRDFEAYLLANGYDLSFMGMESTSPPEKIEDVKDTESPQEEKEGIGADAEREQARRQTEA